jgi:uncharacterized protein (DUF488 family)
MTPVERPPVDTVGHLTRSVTEFVELSQQGQVDLVVDIRSTPRSRTNSQFNLNAFPAALSGRQRWRSQRGHGGSTLR